jgi:hypothetical protein
MATITINIEGESQNLFANIIAQFLCDEPETFLESVSANMRDNLSVKATIPESLEECYAVIGSIKNPNHFISYTFAQ